MTCIGGREGDGTSICGCGMQAGLKGRARGAAATSHEPHPSDKVGWLTYKPRGQYGHTGLGGQLWPMDGLGEVCPSD